MNNIIKDNDKDQFANGQISRDLRANWGGTEPQTRLDAVNVIEQCPDGREKSSPLQKTGSACGNGACPGSCPSRSMPTSDCLDTCASLICPASNHGTE